MGYLSEWKQSVVKEMDDDGIIYWSGDEGYRPVFDAVEANTNLDFEKTDSFMDSEIYVTYREIDPERGLAIAPGIGFVMAGQSIL